MSSEELLSAARNLARRSLDVEADLLVHLAEIDERRLYLECPFPSMFAFCVGELGFSEDAAYNRIMVARAGRRFPAIVDAIRGGRVHLWGMRLLIPHLTEANHRELIAQAAGKSKRDIEDQVAALAPRAPVASMIRSLPKRLSTNGSAALAAHPPQPGLPWTSNDPYPDATDGSIAHPSLEFADPSIELPPQRKDPPIVALAEQKYKIQFSAGPAFRAKFYEARDLMRHRVPDGDMETIVGAALDLLIEQVKKERFAVGRKASARNSAEPTSTTPPTTASPAAAPVTPAPAEVPDTPAPTATSASTDASHGSSTPARAAPIRATPTEQPNGKRQPASRHIPDPIKRAVYERDGGRCTYTDEHGKRCPATGALEFDHIGGFTGHHEVDKIRLLCRAHNQREAEKMYGKSFMESARKRCRSSATRSGTSGPRKARR